MGKKAVSEAVIKRLPRYYRCLLNLEHMGVSKISSKTLGEMLGITASQVRQDFCCFGGFGQQGYGYVVSTLREALQKIIGLNSDYNLIIIGGGNIGKALANYHGFAKEGFHILAVFDIAPEHIDIDNVPVYHIDKLAEFLKMNPVDIAVIATQRRAAQDVADCVTELGIQNIWNFAPIDLNVPQGVQVESVSMIESLFVLSYRMNNQEEETE